MAGTDMKVVKCDIPSTSVLDRRLIETAYFKDSYRTYLTHPHASIVDIFLAIFAHHPMWMKIPLILRNGIVPLFGIAAPSAAEIINFEIKNNYSVGDKIGVWPILSMTENEIVAGRDNKHLDFRLSILKVTDGEATSVVVSTICMVNNRFGKVYLFFVVPFHKWGVRRLISNAVIAKRL
ncbi:MAG TPA: DUF2867 domain-containing protein [Burkholderiaceae bacterium]|jgi:hypothetical protein